MRSVLPQRAPVVARCWPSVCAQPASATLSSIAAATAIFFVIMIRASLLGSRGLCKPIEAKCGCRNRPPAGACIVGRQASASPYIKRSNGHGVPTASPQREAVGNGRESPFPDWRTSSEKMNAKLPTIRKTISIRMTGKGRPRSASPTPPSSGYHRRRCFTRY